MADSGYRSGASGGMTSGQVGPVTEYWSHDRLKKSYEDYLSLKRDEIEERKQAKRYRHASQWTAEQIKVFNKRKQPVVTYNRIGRKIDGVIGLVEKMRQAPKGFPRTRQEMERGGADLATAIVRSVLDTQEWKAKSPICAENGAVDGFGGVEMVLIEGDHGDPDIGFNVTDPDNSFYDPRSKKLDFSDARFLGEGKWVDTDTAIELFPDKAAEIKNSIEIGSELTANPDSDNKWFFSDGRDMKRIRLVSEDYKHNGQWCWAIYTGSHILMEGVSPFVDEKGKTTSRFLWFSANSDQDGDRYGFVRNLKGAQDEINMRRSKGLHILNSRGIIAEGGAFDDIEKARVEAARPDMVLQPNPGKKVEFDESGRIANLEGQLKFLEDAKNEIENFGPNPALIGQGIENKSGRAIALLQQAGIAELGPFIISFRGWKIRVYRAILNACRKYWTAERAIRVTDDERAVDFIKVNSFGVDPMTGMPITINQLQSLDVDIILDEGPDSINIIADTHDALMALAQSGAEVPPDVMLEFMPGLDSDTKKRLIERLTKPDPMKQKAQQIELAGGEAKVQDTQAAAGLKKAQTIKTMVEAQQPPEGGDINIEQQEPPERIFAEVQERMAGAALKRAQAENTHAQRAKVLQDIAFRPREFALETYEAERTANIKEMQAKRPVSRPSAR